MIKSVITTLSLCGLAASALAAPTLYNIDPNHTYPFFAADHNGGVSVRRGMFKSTKGTVNLDRAAHTGTVDITVDTTSLDTGNDKLNEHAKSDAMFDVAKFPTATYQGKFSKFNGDTPTEVDGNLTLHGVTKPVKLTLNSFLCKTNPNTKKETCGADASTTINRADFGITFGQPVFNMAVKIDIQVEALKAE